jgi:hypothetical protein
VLIDGNTVGTFTPSGTSYQVFTTNSFTVTAGAHTIQFLGIDTAGGPSIAFLDDVTVAVAVASPPPAPTPTPTIGDFGFEQIPVGAGNFAVAPTGSAWTFSGTAGSGSGVSGNNSAATAGNPNAPQGSQVAYLQGTGTITQSVAGWAAGSYTVSFDAAQRGNFPGIEDFEVLIDGNTVGTFTPSGTSYQVFTTNSFTVTAGAHTIQFLGIDTDGGPSIAFLDDVTVAQA